MFAKPGHRKYLLVSLVIMLTALPVAYTYEKEHLLGEEIETAAETYGKKAIKLVNKWCQLMEKNTEKKDKRKMTKINDFVNYIEMQSDIDNYGQEDYWATPLELLGRSRGDCEDFSITKYFSLSVMGIPVEKLRITYVMALDYQQAHIVLAYYNTPGSEPLILDNLNTWVLPASKRPDLKPIYGFNGDFIWKSKTSSRDVKVDRSSMPRMSGQFKQWDALLSRMKQEIGHSK
ncbi:MAG: transglutaminase-like cysteine peptidase [Candidatus Brocadiales bacterium]|nr:transglutaminase-like cysteine peptidase [Candidatus Brocadiales bacterium]